MLKHLLTAAFSLFSCLFLFAQTSTDTVSIKIRGLAEDAENPSKQLEDLMIVNLTTQQGNFGYAGGKFSATVRKKDTLLVASTGYEYRKICFKDSVQKNEYEVRVKLKKLTIQLKEVQVFSPRDLEAIEKD